MSGCRPLKDLELLADESPALFPFGVHLHTFLDAETERTATFESRLRSIWRYLVKNVGRFSLTMKPCERAVISVEDMIQDVAIGLAQKDHLWDPARGRYSTFATMVMRSVLSGSRERARTVAGPCNSHARLEGYRQKDAAGELTSSMRQTMIRIEAAMGEYATADDILPDPGNVERETEETLDIVKVAIRTMGDPIQVWVITRHLGLFGITAMSFDDIALRLNITRQQVKNIYKIARINLEERIVGASHEAL